MIAYALQLAAVVGILYLSHSIAWTFGHRKGFTDGCENERDFQQRKRDQDRHERGTGDAFWTGYN